MAVFVLVHGGGHGGWCYQSVARLLRAQGHEVYHPTLSGLADRAHLLATNTGLDMHITDIASLLEYEDLTEVILAGHSYGGMVVTGAADRSLGRVSQLVYLDAAIPVQGEALVDVSPGLLALAPRNRRVDGVELCLWPDDPAVRSLYGLEDGPLTHWAMQRLTPHPWKTFTDPLHLDHPQAVAELPRTVVNCTHTLTVRPDETRHRWLNADRVWEIDTGHDLMLTEPEQVAAMLARLSAAPSERAS